MRYDILLNKKIRNDLKDLAEKMQVRETRPLLKPEDRNNISRALAFFRHTTGYRDFTVAGIDGTGDYPAIAYEDSFVYFTLAQGTIYRTDPLCGLREEGPEPDPVTGFALIPEDENDRRKMLLDAFEDLVGVSIDEAIQRSDYKKLKQNQTGDTPSISFLRNQLLCPHASDSSNLGIQFRSTGELSAALRILQGEITVKYLLTDGTMSLPFVSRKGISLFFEHLKRLCCVAAREKGTGFFTLSKSHGIPSADLVEEIASEKAGLTPKEKAEHWYLRFPEKGLDKWSLPLAEGRMIPPAGAISYLVRFHGNNTPLYRLDMDRDFWEEHIRGRTPEETVKRETEVFEDLDYTAHEQRCYGYPYPIKAAHDRASLTEGERTALRRQIIDAAAAAGMKRSLFRDVSIMTGHK